MKANTNATIFAMITLAAWALAGTQYVTAAEYTVTDLGTLGGVSSGVSGVNNEGLAVGASTVQSGALHAYLWEDGTMHDLGTPPDYLVSSASSLNDFGQVIGTAQGQYQSQYAYVFDDGLWTYLGTLPGPGLDYSATADINNAAQIVGYSFTLGPGGAHRAWIWEDGAMTDLGTLGGEDSSASAINELGQVVGWAQTGDSGFVTHAYLWEDGVMTDLGVLPGDTGSAAADVNLHGQVCGSSSHPVPPYNLKVSRACLWDDGELLDLGTLPGYARSLSGGINDHGQVVGYLGVSLSGGTTVAFIWEDGVMTDLNTLIPPDSGWVLKSASEINEVGQIVGWGSAPNGEYHGFLLTPHYNSDFNGDGNVDAADLALLLGAWGPCVPCPPYDPADLNEDCNVDAADLAELLGDWGPCP